MVFVTVGTQKQQFTRLLRLVDNSEELKNTQVVVQAGNTHYRCKNVNMFEFMNINEMYKNIEQAEFVICHGGVGSIFDALNRGKKVLAVPRLEKYKEHINDHQLEVCGELERLGYIKVYDESKLFDDVIKELRSTELRKYECDNSFLEILKKEI